MNEISLLQIWLRRLRSDCRCFCSTEEPGSKGSVANLKGAMVRAAAVDHWQWRCDHPPICPTHDGADRMPRCFRTGAFYNPLIFQHSPFWRLGCYHRSQASSDFVSCNATEADGGSFWRGQGMHDVSVVVLYAKRFGPANHFNKRIVHLKTFLNSRMFFGLQSAGALSFWMKTACSSHNISLKPCCYRSWKISQLWPQGTHTRAQGPEVW